MVNNSRSICQQKLAVIVLNWNGWRDTIACLDSLFRELPENIRVIVCDNASQDNSLSHIQAWAEGQLLAELPPFIAPRPAGAISYRCYDRATAERGGSEDDPQLVLVSTGANLGFAGGNNVGVRYALANDFDYVWLLNNDTVVNADSWRNLLARMEADPAIGLCGSTLIYYYEPQIIQAMGGSSFDYARGVGAHLGVGLTLQEFAQLSQEKLTAVEQQIDYVVGASMMVSRPFLEQIGLMSEEYFLYFEEIDWATRAKQQFRLAWAPASWVWHKEGGTIGSNHRQRASDISLTYMSRNRLRFARRHTPEFYWPVWRRMVFEALVYLKRKDWTAVKIILRAILASLKDR